MDANNGRCMDEYQETQIIQRIEHYLERYGRDEKLVVFDGRFSIFEQIKLFAFKDVLKAQLKLALKWDRIDVAKRFIFNDDDIWKVNLKMPPN